MSDQTANIARIVQALQELTKVSNAAQQTIVKALPPAAGSPVPGSP